MSIPQYTHDEWFERFPGLDSPLFTLRVPLSDGSMAVIRAWEGPWDAPNHTRLYCELKRGGKVIFPRGDRFTVGLAGQHSIDGDSAKALVLSLFELRPGDTDSEFFEGETAEQLAFRESHGETLTIARVSRYGED